MIIPETYLHFFDPHSCLSRICHKYRSIIIFIPYHPVDSSEMAFKTATIQAFKKGFMEAGPVLLEPSELHLNVTVLSVSAGLLLILGIHIRILLNGLTECNLRRL